SRAGGGPSARRVSPRRLAAASRCPPFSPQTNGHPWRRTTAGREEERTKASSPRHQHTRRGSGNQRVLHAEAVERLGQDLDSQTRRLRKAPLAVREWDSLAHDRRSEGVLATVAFDQLAFLCQRERL